MTSETDKLRWALEENAKLRAALSEAREFAMRLSDGWRLTRDGSMTNQGCTKKYPNYDECHRQEALLYLKRTATL